MATNTLAAASGVQIPDHVLDTFKALPYPICPVPDVAQDDTIVGDFYSFSRRWLGDDFKRFDRFLEFSRVIPEPRKTGYIQVSKIGNLDLSHQSGFSSKLKASVQSVINFKVAQEHKLSYKLTANAVVIENLNIEETLNAFKEPARLKLLTGAIQNYKRYRNTDDFDDLYIVEGGVKCADVKISFTSESSMETEFALKHALTQGLVNVDAGLNMDRDGQSLVYSQNTYLLFKYSRVKSYVPLLPSL